jgi:hypothetical protein
MKTKFNYITLGFDCSPAAALRGLELREFALPFDWIKLTVDILERCIKDDFKNFHKSLKFNYNKKMLIDYYGFQFIHDYPLISHEGEINNTHLGEGIIAEKDSIIDNWQDYYEVVYEKYKRRIERFREIMKSPKPIIVLCRHNIAYVIQLKKFLNNHYNKNDIYFVVSSKETYEDNYIKLINTERNNQWNELDIWKEGLEKFWNH